MQITAGIAKKRITTNDNVTDKIVNYDSDNSYPQRMLYTIATSGTAIGCVNLYAKYISGRGFVDAEFNKKIINRKGQNIKKLLELTARDISRHNGFIWHMNYNALGQITEVQHVPFPWGRFQLPDDVGYISHIVIYPDWDKKKNRNMDRRLLKRINVYNPDPEVVKQQIVLAEGINKYKGQVLYYSMEPNDYPLAPYDSVLLDIETDGRSKVVKNRNIKNGWLAGHALMKKGKFTDETKRTEFMESLETFQGEEATSSVVLIETEIDEEFPELKPFTHNINDKTFEYTEGSIERNIINNFGQPPILRGIQNNSLGDSNSKYTEAKTFYDEFTNTERMIVSEWFENVFTKFPKPINTSNDWTIIPQSGVVKADEKKPLALSIGIGGVSSLQSILQDAILQPEQKVNILIIVFGIPEADARLMVGTNKIEPAQPNA